MRAQPDRVDIWHAGLDAHCEPVPGILSTAEHARAERFATDLLRRRFRARRAALRRLLARYLETDPAALVFDAGPWGKPVLVAPSTAAGLAFNLSHSDNRMVCAVSAQRRIGVDIERPRAGFDLAALARRHFSSREIASWTALDPADRGRGFLACWTRKEAYIKAIGLGLSMPLDSFSVSLAPGEAAALLAVEGSPGEAARWRLAEFVAGEGVVGAIAVEGDGWTAVHRRWPEDAASPGPT
ncbi:MAG: 4'-phosphopantetheinyl transferase superfamily protein [Alphaproteobacteria bacterium]|nr:4'-phosphopantetheinyl transferase superfamily protein [Alphaproteobacteria bacterium]